MALTGLVAANNLGDVVDIEKTWDNIGNNISATVFVPSPTLDLNFASNKSLLDNVSGQNLVTFSRASTGTFVGSNGLIQTAASGVPRFDHNGATGESLGLLVEEARTNAEPNSNSFNWAPTNPKISSSITIDPFLGTNAKRLIPTTVNEVHGWQRYLVYGTGNYAFSMFVRPAGYSRISIGCNNGGANDFTVDLSGIGSYTAGNATTFPTGLVKLADGWFRLTWQWNNGGGGGANNTFPYCIILNNSGQSTFTGDGISGVDFYGFQMEAGTFSTSYIPTSGATATRAGEAATISGANFSKWYNYAQGSFYVQYKYNSGIKNISACILGTSGYEGNGFINSAYGTAATTLSVKTAVGFTDLKTLNPGGNSAYSNPSVGDGVGGKFEGYPVDLEIGARLNSPSGSKTLNGTIARIVYHPIRLTNATLQAFTTYGPVSSFPYSFSIKGRDILALKEVNKTSTRDFIFTKGLLSRAQPRLTTASQYTSSGVALRDAAMPKFAPVTRGNYFFSSGLTLSGATVQINGTNALSIATSPFSSSTATVPLLFAGLRPQTNWRISETMASGVVASPESAIPIATGDFLLFMKAGQS
jgi:hypothetical protein